MWHRIFRPGLGIKSQAAYNLARWLTRNDHDAEDVVPETYQKLMAQGVLDSHLRSLLPGHIADVQSSDRHTVKPWLNGKVDFSPPVADFAEQGFPLIGGRLDSVEGRTVAVRVYQRRQHFINLYVWPSPGSRETAAGLTAQRGYDMIHRTRAGSTWWLVSDVNAADLETLAGLLRK